MNTEQRRKWLGDQMKQLREMWQLVFKYYRYDTYISKKEKKKMDKKCQENYRLIKECCHKIESLNWGTDIEDLKGAQAETFYMVGTLYAEGGNLDRACEYLLKAKNIMEQFSLHSIFKEMYIRTCNYLVMIYIEKHHDDEDTRRCLEAAEDICGKLQKGEDISTQLHVETSMQRIIYESKIYFQDDNRETMNSSERIEECITRAHNGIAKLNEKAEKNVGKNKEDLWLKKAKDTLYASEGVYYKWIFLNRRKKSKKSNSDYMDFFQKATNAFLEGMALDEKNTICWGNVAVLLRDSLEYKEVYKEQYKWLIDRLRKEAKNKKWGINLRSEDDTDSTSGDNIESDIDIIERFLTEKVLKADKNNMLILNLLAMKKREKQQSGKVGSKTAESQTDAFPYISLLQAELRREFKKLDDILLAERVYPKQGQDPLRALKIEILNVTIQ